MILETFKRKVEQHQTQCLWERWKHPQQPLKPESRQSEMSHLSRIRREQPQWNSTSTRLKHFHCLLHQQLFTQSQVHAAVHVWYYYVLYMSGKWVHMSFINKIICLLTPLFLVLTVWNSFFFFKENTYFIYRVMSCFHFQAILNKYFTIILDRTQYNPQFLHVLYIQIDCTKKYSFFINVLCCN